MRVLLVPNNENGGAVEAACALAERLDARGDEAVLSEEDARACGMDARGADPGTFGELDLIVALGGDGTILKAVHAVPDRNAPILGVNLGRLGFLCGALGSQLPGAVEDALAGRGVIERCAMLRASATSAGRDAGTHLALNEVFVGRPPGGRAVDVAITVDGQRVGSMVCDGVIVAAPAGSTAYALSAGGPIVAPDMRAMIVVPVCPHTLASRPLVVSGASAVELSFPDPARAGACLAVDGDQVPCRMGLEGVRVVLDDRDVTLVRFEGRGFYRALSETFFGV